jgi:predicted transcriptional regulator
MCASVSCEVEGGVDVVVPDAGRVAVMSIRPQFAEAILAGTKLVEFRKRRLAPDVTTVLIYATMPVGKVVGVFEVADQHVASPTSLWNTHKAHAGIARAAYREYYRGRRSAVGIVVGEARRLVSPVTLTELDPRLVAPQSFVYLQLDPGRSSGDDQARGRLREALAFSL